jgi:16S rRNA processing protein RimM
MKPRITPTVGVTADGWVSVGVVARAHGIRGGIKVHLWNPDGDSLRPGVEVRIGERTWPVRDHRTGVLSVDGIDDREGADALAGQEIFVRRADFPEAEAYLVDLIGAVVVDEEGRELGRVAGFADNNAQALLAVKTGDDGEVLVPFVPAIVVATEKGRVVLRPPPGLFGEGAIE